MKAPQWDALNFRLTPCTSLHPIFFFDFFCNIGKLVIYEAENGEGTENCLGFFKVWPISGSKCQERKKGPKKPGKTGGNFPAQPPTESAT